MPNVYLGGAGAPKTHIVEEMLKIAQGRVPDVPHQTGTAVLRRWLSGDIWNAIEDVNSPELNEHLDWQQQIENSNRWSDPERWVRPVGWGRSRFLVNYYGMPDPWSKTGGIQ